MIQPQRIRLKVTPTARTPLVDAFDNQTPRIWRGNDIQVEIGLFTAAGAVEDISNLASLTVEVDTSQTSTGSPLMTKTVLLAAMDQTLDAASWADYSKQHATVEFSATETNLSLGTDNQKTYWLVVHGVTSAGKTVTLGYGSIIVEEDNAGTAGDPPTNDPTYYTQEEVNALLALGGPLTFSALTGGDTGDLDALDPDNYALGRLALGPDSTGQIGVFILKEGTDAAVADQIVRPTNYDDLETKKVWERRL
jgi:hypothetical protein